MRKLALGYKQVVKDSDGQVLVHPSLPNIRQNYSLLKGYTQHMAEQGVIVTNRMSYIKPPITAFYESFELDVKNEAAVTAIHGSAFVVKQMLGVVKRKWSRWELPRATGTRQVLVTFFFALKTLRCSSNLYPILFL